MIPPRRTLDSSLRLHPRRCWPALALLASCQTATPRPHAEQEVAAAVGLPRAIEFRTEGGPVDVPGEQSPELPLAHALEQALSVSPALQVELARVRAALAEADQARLLPNPILDVVLRYPEGGGRVGIETGAALDLAALLQRPRRSSAAQDRLRGATARAVATGIAVAAELQERYAAVQALDELTPLLRERRELLGQLIALARSRLEFGEAARLDVTTLETQGVELDIEIAEREAERREGRLALARLLGRPSGSATWALEGWSELPALDGDEGPWLAAALEHRPEVQERRWELAALGDEAAAAGLSILAGSEVGVDAERDGDWSLGPAVALPLPLFDLGGARRDRAAAEVVAARHGLVESQRAVVEEVRRAYSSYRTARENLERVRAELIPLQRERREQVEAIYLAGQVDVTAVLLAEQDLQAAHVKLVELEEQAAVLLVRLERAVGGAGVVRALARRAPGERREPEAKP